LAVFLPTLIFLLVAWTTYGRFETAVEEELRRSSRFLAGEVQRLVESSTTILRDIDRMVAAQTMSAHAAPSLIQRRLLSSSETLVPYTLIAVIDRDGRLLSANTNEADAQISVADREYFMRARDGHTNEVFVGIPIIGRISGTPSIPISRRLTKARDFWGVALITVSQQALHDMLTPEGASPSDMIALIRDDGQLLTAEPRGLPPASIAKGSGNGSSRQPLEDIRLPGDTPNTTSILGKLSAVQRVQGTELKVVIARSRSSALRPWLYDMMALLTIFVAGKIGLVAAIRKAEANSRELISANRRLQSTLDTLSAHVAILDQCGRVVALNEACRRFTARHVGRMPELTVGADYLTTWGYYVQCADRGEIGCALDAVIAGRLPAFRTTYQYRSATGELVWFRLMATNLAMTNSEALVVVVHEDVTDIMRSETALRRATGQLLQRQDEERRRIARGLHDSTAQDLIGAEWEIKLARNSLHREPDHADERLGRARDLIRASIEELRTLAYLLHPPMLDETGVPNALRWFLGGFERRTGIAVTVVVDADMDGRRLPTEIEVALFRVAQEALTNVHRHAGVRTARLELRMEQDQRSVVLLVRDDGAGLAPGQECEPGSTLGGTGILSMQERLRALSGQLSIRSDQGGTEVRATVKL
jgi:signal transduction histidine kinase